MWFKYGTTAKWVETIDENDSLNVDDYVKVKATRETVETLRGYLVSKLKSKRRVWDIVITADEMSDSVKYDFMTEFFQSGELLYINIDDANGSTPASNWIEVDLQGGVMQVEFIEWRNTMREVKFILTESDGSL